MIHAIIMAGGAGTRFWPASRMNQPKQLLSLDGSDQTMIQSTVWRMGDLCPAENVRIVTNQRLVDPIHEQLTDMPKSSIIGEPCKRDTAPCIGLAAALVHAVDPDATMVVMPSDHVITTDEQFQSAMRYASALVDAQPERILTFGIKPTYPATAYGYIERGAAIGGDSSNPPTFEVARFREKPDADTAQQFVEQGTFYWNAGIFVWKAKTILDALQNFEPEMSAHIAKIAAAIGTDSFDQVLHDEFHAIQGKSIDFAVMEKYQPVCVIEAPFEWDDVGNWTSLERLAGQDDSKNTLIGDQMTIDSRNCIVRNTTADGHLVVSIGMENCIVVRTPDATLIVDKSREADVKKVVEQLTQQGRDEYL